MQDYRTKKHISKQFHATLLHKHITFNKLKNRNKHIRKSNPKKHEIDVNNT